jgi:penicillin-binding protein 1A
MANFLTKYINFENGKFRKVIKRIWIGFVIFFGGFYLYIFSVHINLFNFFGKMPDLKVLENPRSDLASEVYSSDNVLLGKYFIANRKPVELEQVSPNVVNALLATEDARFQQHSGIDPRATFRVFFGLLTFDSGAGGGSTLSQQVARNLFALRNSREYRGLFHQIPGLRSLVIKTKEWIVAVQIERNYTKKEILMMYLNTVDFGSNALGIYTAANTFYSKTPDKLSITEASLLIGILQNPTFWNPVRKPERAIKRRNIVLGQMVKYGYLKKEDFDNLKEKPLGLHYKPEDYTQGLAPYFRAYLKRDLEKIVEEKGYNLYTDGLKIYTTIDSRMQQYAEEAVIAHMQKLQDTFEEQWRGKNPWIDDNGREIKDYIEREAKTTDRYRELKEYYGDNEDSVRIMMNKPVKMRVFSWKHKNFEKDTVMSPMDSIRYHKHFLHCGFMSMDPNTGDVKAWVGGTDFKHFQFDHVKQDRRQPGSSFKPIIYSAAIDLKGYTPCDEKVDEPVTFSKDEYGQPWTPRNSTGVYTGQKLTLRRAIGQSVNTVSASLVKELGPQRIVDYASRFGVDTKNMEAVPSICLGTQDVSVYELLGVYSTFVNAGVWTEPRYLVRIEDRNGKIIKENPPKTKAVLNDQIAYMMVHMLKGGVQEPGGTARGLQFYKCFANNEIGGKTGTTQNYSDGWFMGITQNLVSGGWVGGDDKRVRFRNYLGEGARVSLPIWGMYMDKVYADATLGIQKVPFKKPKVFNYTLDCELIKEAASRVDSLDYQKPTTDSLSGILN